MNVMIRGVDVVAVKKIDDLCHKQGISRSEFLRRMIGTVLNNEVLVEIEDKYIQLVEGCVRVVTENTAALENLRNAILEEGGYEGE